MHIYLTGIDKRPLVLHKILLYDESNFGFLFVSSLVCLVPRRYTRAGCNGTVQ